MRKTKFKLDDDFLTILWRPKKDDTDLKLCLRSSFALNSLLLPYGTIGSTEEERRIIGGTTEASK